MNYYLFVLESNKQLLCRCVSLIFPTVKMKKYNSQRGFLFHKSFAICRSTSKTVQFYRDFAGHFVFIFIINVSLTLKALLPEICPDSSFTGLSCFD